MVLAIKELEPGQEIGEGPISEPERKDLNRPRVYLKDLAMRYGVPCYNTLGEAVEHICDWSEEMKQMNAPQSPAMRLSMRSGRSVKDPKVLSVVAPPGTSRKPTKRNTVEPEFAGAALR